MEDIFTLPKVRVVQFVLWPFKSPLLELSLMMQRWSNAMETILALVVVLHTRKIQTSEGRFLPLFFFLPFIDLLATGQVSATCPLHVWLGCLTNTRCLRKRGREKKKGGKKTKTVTCRLGLIPSVLSFSNTLDRACLRRGQPWPHPRIANYIPRF